MDKYVSYLIIALTFILFIAAIFVKGFSHDLLLEAGVFLVSAKIIIANYHMNQHQHTIEKRFDEISRKFDILFTRLLKLEEDIEELD